LAGGNANALLIKEEFGNSFPMCDKTLKNWKKCHWLEVMPILCQS
jgi:hypothetical protein